MERILIAVEDGRVVKVVADGREVEVAIINHSDQYPEVFRFMGEVVDELDPYDEAQMLLDEAWFEAQLSGEVYDRIYGRPAGG